MSGLKYEDLNPHNQRKYFCRFDKFNPNDIEGIKKVRKHYYHDPMYIKDIAGTEIIKKIHEVNIGNKLIVQRSSQKLQTDA